MQVSFFDETFEEKKVGILEFESGPSWNPAGHSYTFGSTLPKWKTRKKKYA